MYLVIESQSHDHYQILLVFLQPNLRGVSLERKFFLSMPVIEDKRFIASKGRIVGLQVR